MSHVDEGTLHAYLDGELPPGERTAVDAHLSQCATCQAAFAEERTLRERASALLESARPAERPAPPFEQLRRTPKKSPWLVRMPFAWAASIAVALALGYYAVPQQMATRAAPAPAAGPTTVVLARDRAVPEEEKQKPREQSGTRANARGSAAPVDKPARSELAARADSYDALGGVADAGSATLKTPQLRHATPASAAPAPSAPIVVSGAPTNRVVPRMLTTTQWPVISRGAAASLLGSEPLGLPGLATRKIQRNPAGDGTVVVEQTLDSATVIQIFQRPAMSQGYDSSAQAFALGAERDRRARESAPVRADRLARFVGRLRVEISGPLSADSLNRLLEQVEPLP